LVLADLVVRLRLNLFDGRAAKVILAERLLEKPPQAADRIALGLVGLEL
jgi:hypothetical protein